MKIHPCITLLTLPLGILSSSASAQDKPLPVTTAKMNQQDLLKPPALLAKKGKKDASSPLRVESLDVKVTVTGNTAETTMTMTFRNDTDRVLEGELVFPLAQGMTISRYALEVNGVMRQGVIVEKERARAIYEETIRQQIDPGLVEWTKGNNFRTRIYPIPAKGTKTVSVSYVETLQSDGKQLKYQLPLAYQEKLADFKLNIEVIRPGGKQKVIVNDAAGLKLTVDDAKQWKLNAHQKDYAANKSLKLAIPQEKIANRLVYKNARGETFFYALDPVKAAGKTLARPVPKSLNLVWDASNSGAKRDHAKELILLEAYVKKTGATKVTLQVLRNTLEAPKEFSLEKGTDALVKHLRGLRYDGATRLGALDLKAMTADAVILVTDGVSTLGQKRPSIGSKPVFILHASQSAEHSLLEFLGAKSGGAYINLQKNDKAAGLAAMTSQQYSLLSITGEGVEEVYPSVATAVQKQASIAGKITSNKPVKLTLKYGIAGKVMHTSVVEVDPNDVSKEASSVPRLWAQKKLLELDAEAEKNRFEIVGLAQRHGIVTRFTSLLVLDRMEDYVRHRIAPPEPELQEEYDKRVRELPDPNQPDTSHLAEVVGQWKEMVEWHKGKHLRVGELLVKQTTQGNDRIAAIEKDLKAQLTTEVDKEKRAKVQEQLTAITKVRALQQQAVVWKTKHGGIHAGPDAAYHSLLEDYRKALTAIVPARKQNPAKAGLDFAESSGFGDGAAPARPVAPRNLGGGGGDDLFGGGDGDERPGEGGAGGNAAAANEPFSSPDFESKKKADKGGRSAGATLAAWDPKTPYLKALRKAAKEKQDIEALYFEWKKKNESSSAFYLDVADFLFQQKRPELALRVLSNVAELDMENPALLRILGHRYDQLGKLDLAEIIFREVLSLRSDEPQSHRDLALVLEKSGAYQEAADKLWHVASKKWDSRLEGIQLIALTELNALIAKHRNEINTEAYSKEVIYNLDADVRILLTWDADNTDIDLWVTDPLGVKCDYSHNRTKTGGRMSRDFTQGYGPEVFMVKNAINGDYTIAANYYGNSQQKLAGETTIQATLVTNWGRENEKRQAITLRLKGNKEVIKVGKLSFSGK